MKLNHRIEYDAGTDEVHAMLMDIAFREEVCERQKVLDYTISIEETDDAWVVDVNQLQSTAGAPGVVQKVVGSSIGVHKVETWRSTSHADLTVLVPGKPAALHGSITLAARGGRTVQTITGDVKVKIPLVGGALEQFVARLLVIAYDKEIEAGRDYLGR